MPRSEHARTINLGLHRKTAPVSMSVNKAIAFILIATTIADRDHNGVRHRP